MADKVKVSQLACFVETASDTLTRIGKGATALSVAYSPTETSETYIDEDNATTTVDGYAVSIDEEQTAYAGEPIFEFVDNIRQNHKTGSECETKVVLVNIYDKKTEGEYSAQQYNATVSVSEFGGNGGESAKIKYKLNLNGDPTQGKATITNGKLTFTASV